MLGMKHIYKNPSLYIFFANCKYVFPIRMKHKISQVGWNTEPDDETINASIPVNVHKVTKIFEIIVEDSVREEIVDKLESTWDSNTVTSFSVGN